MYLRLKCPCVNAGAEMIDVLIAAGLPNDESSLLEFRDRASIGRRLRQISRAITELSQRNTSINGANMRLNTTV